MGVAIQTAYSPAGLSNEWACHEQANGTNRSSPLGSFPFSSPRHWLGWVKSDCRYGMHNSHFRVHFTRGTRAACNPNKPSPVPPQWKHSYFFAPFYRGRFIHPGFSQCPRFSSALLQHGWMDTEVIVMQDNNKERIFSWNSFKHKSSPSVVIFHGIGVSRGTSHSYCTFDSA